MTRARLVRLSKITLFIGYIVLATVLLSGCGTGNGTPITEAGNAALVVNAEPVEAAAGYTIQREFIGRVEATRQSQVGFELPGRLDRLAVDEGDEVAAGDLLARLDTARLEARLAEARAALRQAVSARDLAVSTLKRNEEAVEFDGVSQQELDLAREAASAARARVAAAQARINTVQVDIDKSRLLAPYDAVVVTRYVDEGNIIAAGNPVLQLQELAAPEIRVGVSGDVAGAIAEGNTRTVMIGDEHHTATVRAVLPVRDPATRTVDVILELGDRRAVPGDLARIVLPQTVAEPGFWLPVDALSEGSRGLWTANVVRPIDSDNAIATDATHVVEPRPVEVLHAQDSDVYVRGALTAGDRYVTGGTQRIVPNQHVRVATDTAIRTATGTPTR